MRPSNEIQRITADMSLVKRAIAFYVQNTDDDKEDVSNVVDSYLNLVDAALGNFTNSLLHHEEWLTTRKGIEL
jgi:hypothetical protein